MMRRGAGAAVLGALLLWACGDSTGTPDDTLDASSGGGAQDASGPGRDAADERDASRADAAPSADASYADASPEDASPDGAAADGGSTETWRQVDHVGQPFVVELLLTSASSQSVYNAFAPRLDDAPDAARALLVDDAKTTLRSLYLGTCFINGSVPGLTAATGLKPMGQQCNEVGSAMFSDAAGTQLKASVAAAAQAYADRVFDTQDPDVLRIDTSSDSGYLTVCGDLASTPLLCGGRRLTDDVVDVTYDLWLAGAANSVSASSPAQFRALVSDGVQFDARSTNSQNAGNLTAPDSSNRNQFHPPVSGAFPYAASPL